MQFKYYDDDGEKYVEKSECVHVKWDVKLEKMMYLF